MSVSAPERFKTPIFSKSNLLISPVNRFNHVTKGGPLPVLNQTPGNPNILIQASAQLNLTKPNQQKKIENVEFIPTATPTLGGPTLAINDSPFTTPRPKYKKSDKLSIKIVTVNTNSQLPQNIEIKQQDKRYQNFVFKEMDFSTD